VLFDAEWQGKPRKLFFHHDRNGLSYTLDRVTGELLRADKAFPWVNWVKEIKDGRPVVDPRYSTHHNGEDVNTKGICPAALGTKDQQPMAYSPKTGLMYIPYNTVCMDYEPFRVTYTAGQPYVGATLSMYPAPGGDTLGAIGAWDPIKGEHKWLNIEPFSVWSGVLATAGDIVAYGTLEGWFKVLDKDTGRELYRFKTPSGIIGNVMTYLHGGKQYMAVYSGIGGWAGIGLAAGLTEDTAGLGAVGAYKALANYTQLGGQLTVFTLN
jgi:PQQ-dependent dehydrogenase (methanol/ethanol family)